MKSECDGLLPASRPSRKNGSSAVRLSTKAILAKTNATKQLQNYQNIIYYIDINVGTSQTIGVGSIIFVAIATYCLLRKDLPHILLETLFSIYYLKLLDKQSALSTDKKQMKEITITVIILLILRDMVTAHYLPVNRLKKTDFSAAQISANAALTNTNATIQLQNYQNIIYYIYINVGTPAQTMGVQFDTGSNILWLPTQKAGVTPFYNTTKSSTFTNTTTPGSIQYADGTGVSGTYGTDILSVSGTPINITAEFLWVNKDNLNFPPQIAGLVGMGFTTTPNFLDVAYQKKEIQSPAFALTIQTGSQQSYIYYNQIPESITNSSYFVNVVGNTYWQVNVLGVTVGGIDMTSVSANVAVIDSGTSYFYLNSALFNNIIGKFFQNCNNSKSPPQCPCSSTSNWPTFSFIFDGIQAYIEPSQYTGIITKTICTYNFGTLSTVGSILLLGDIFFQGYTVTFNKLTSQIGFKGNLGKLQDVMPDGSRMYGYISMGLILLIILVGMVTFCLLGKNLPPEPHSVRSIPPKYIQFNNINRNIIVTPPKSYRIQQPLL